MSLSMRRHWRAGPLGSSSSDWRKLLIAWLHLDCFIWSFPSKYKRVGWGPFVVRAEVISRPASAMLSESMAWLMSWKISCSLMLFQLIDTNIRSFAQDEPNRLFFLVNLNKTIRKFYSFGAWRIWLMPCSRWQRCTSMLNF